MIELENVSRTYRMGEVRVTVLDAVSLRCKKGITIIVVTHEEDIAAYTQRWKIVEEKKR